MKRISLMLFLTLSLVSCTGNGGEAKEGESKVSDKQLQHLTKEQREVTQLCATENPFNNAYWDNHEPGIYVDIVDGKPLFGSADKFDSGTGWPSFTQPLDEKSLSIGIDKSHGMERNEVKSKDAGSHLGHVFDDGPGPKHKRFCINSASLRFIHVLNLEKEGYGQYLKLFSKELIQEQKKKREKRLKNHEYEEIILAGGCFWGMQELIKKIPGVIDTEVGYSGGTVKDATYEQVKTGKTGHAESVKVVFDPKKAPLDKLFDLFFKMHDPTTQDQQGNDRGSQYRSAVFFTTDDQKKVAEKKIKEWESKWKKPIVTEVTKASPFYKAEEYHQDYLRKHPDGYTCHYYREF